MRCSFLGHGSHCLSLTWIQNPPVITDWHQEGLVTTLFVVPWPHQPGPSLQFYNVNSDQQKLRSPELDTDTEPTQLDRSNSRNNHERV